MADELTSDRLEAVLTSIGHHLEIPPAPAEPMAAVPRASRRRPGPMLVAAAALAVAVGGVALIPSTRAAVADLLGIGSTRVEVVGDEPIGETELPHIAQGLTEISIDEATTILGGELPDTADTALGPPEAVYRMPEGGVLLAWRDDTATLWVRDATETEIIVRKLVGSGEDVESVDGVGTEALLITDVHLLETPRRRVAAQRVLLWYDADHEYRLEADMAPADLIAIARDLR